MLSSRFLEHTSLFQQISIIAYNYELRTAAYLKCLGALLFGSFKLTTAEEAEMNE